MKHRPTRTSPGNAGSLADPANFSGLSYDLEVELGDRDTSRAALALRHIWGDPTLEGPFAERDEEPGLQAVGADDTHHVLYGLATLPSGNVIVCETTVLSQDDESHCVHLSLPHGALLRVDSRVGGWPGGSQGDASLEWRRPIDKWLTKIALSLYGVVPFRRALIGWEENAESMVDVSRGVPDVRCATHLIPQGSSAEVFPATT